MKCYTSGDMCIGVLYAWTNVCIFVLRCSVAVNLRLSHVINIKEWSVSGDNDANEQLFSGSPMRAFHNIF